MQLFGEIETQHGKSKAMLCVDDDCKQEWMLHMWEGEPKKSHYYAKPQSTPTQ